MMSRGRRAMIDVEAAVAEAIRDIRFVVFDFDGVFTDNHVYVSEDGKEMVRCWRSDGLGLRKLDRLGLGSAILSTEANPLVLHRAAKLKIECTHNCEDKLRSLDELCARKALRRDQLAFVGNDINDLACLRAVRLPIIVADAHPDVWSAAKHRTVTPGGRGAVREVCDLFEQVLVGRPG